MKAGLGISIRFAPLHILHQRLGLNLAKVLPAIHSLTGSDISSKVGTKKAALQGDPTKYLQSFGINAVMDDSTAKEAEKYPVNVVAKGICSTSFEDTSSINPKGRPFKIYHQQAKGCCPTFNALTTSPTLPSTFLTDSYVLHQ